MKRRLVVLTLALAVTAGSCACGSDKAAQSAQTSQETAVETAVETEAAEAAVEEISTEDLSSGTEVVEVVHYEYDTPASSTYELETSELVKELTDYSAIPVEVSAGYEITEENEDATLILILSNCGLDSYTEVTDRTEIQEGDLVKVDYKGMKDGEAFDGGTAEAQMLDVYNNQSASGTGFIDGFTDALKGAEVGTVVEGPCTFPENYQSEELAGQDVVFEFTIHGIYKPISLADMTDEDVASGIGAIYGMDTVDTLREAIDSLLESNAYNEKVEAVTTYMLENSDIEVPEDYLESRLNEYAASIADMYCGETQTLEEYFSAYGVDMETMLGEWRENLESTIASELIFQAVSEKENIEISEDEIEERIEAIVSYYGYESKEALFEEYGYGDIEYGREYVEKQLVGSKAMDQLIQSAVVSYK